MNALSLRFLAALAFSLASLAPAAWAADAPAGAAPAPEPARTAVPLKIVGRDVIKFRSTVFGYGPTDRVEGAKSRLLAAYQKNKHLKFSTRHTAEGSQVLADAGVMFIVTPGDVDRAAGETTEAAATRSVDVLASIVDDLHAREDPRSLLQGFGIAAAVTLLAILLMRFILAADRRASLWFARRVADHVGRVRVSGVAMLDEGNWLRVARAAVHGVAWVAAGILAFLWLNAVLEAIPYTRPWGEQLTSILLGVLATVGNGLVESVPGLLFVVVIIVMARIVSRTGAAFFQRVTDRNLSFGWVDRDTAPPARMIFTGVVWLFALAMAYPYIPGSDSRAFQGLSVLVGLMVSMGASGTVSQGASGLILMFSRAFRVGEYVRIQDHEGTVIELTAFTTRIRTGMGEEILLPNTYVMGGATKNYSRAIPGAGFVLDTVVTIGYDASWRQVEAMLKEAAGRTEGIMADPAPRVMKTALSDFYTEYRLIAYATPTMPLPRAEALSHLHGNIVDVFNEYGVQIMSPHYLGDPAHEKVVPKSRWFEAPAKPPKG
ncbi:mechanosensitive ion channel family protein [Usitatibacter rugosus]|nr:mechanosensitive ion channel domain-containing protein [Usitatibacter rugosus]